MERDWKKLKDLCAKNNINWIFSNAKKYKVRIEFKMPKDVKDYWEAYNNGIYDFSLCMVTSVKRRNYSKLEYGICSPPRTTGKETE